jgi:transporter family protein
MIGSLCALLTAIFFALNDIIIRRAVLKVDDAGFGTLLSVPLGVPLFFLILAFTSQLGSIFRFSSQSYVWLSLAGIFFFVVGRSLSYKCIQLVGANITSLLRRTNILVAVAIGIGLLHEPLSGQFVIGILFIIVGITLAGLSPQLLQNPYDRVLKIPVKAYALGLGSGVAWGLAPIFAKLGLAGSESPIAGAFISFSAATAILSISLANKKRRIAIIQMKARAAGLFLLAGLLSCMANLLRYVALNLVPASVVTPLVAISPVFLLVFSYLFNRKLEVFSKPVIVGTVTVVIGTILLI